MKRTGTCLKVSCALPFCSGYSTYLSKSMSRELKLLLSNKTQQAGDCSGLGMGDWLCVSVTGASAAVQHEVLEVWL